MEFRVWVKVGGLGSGFSGFRAGVWGLGSELRVQGFELRVYPSQSTFFHSGSGTQGFICKGLGLRILREVKAQDLHRAQDLEGG